MKHADLLLLGFGDWTRDIVIESRDFELNGKDISGDLIEANEYKGGRYGPLSVILDNSVEGINYCTGSSSTSKNSDKALPQTVRGYSNRSSSNFTSKNKRPPPDDSDDNTDKDDDTPKRPRLTKVSPEDKKPSRRLACPFYKHDPQYYSTRNPDASLSKAYRTCAGPRFENISRTK
jgi:hypothetical protein